GETNLSIIALAVVLLTGLVMLLWPRKYLTGLFLTVGLLMPLGQQIVIAGLHFTMLRILLLFSWIRILIIFLSGGRDTLRFHSTRIDKAIVLWILSSVITFTLLWGETGAFVDRMGLVYNALGAYFLMRMLCRTEQDVDAAVKVLAGICAILALCMLNEQLTGRNLFSVFGGVPEFAYLREGKLRSQGPFAHPILSGTFGATLFALFAGLWWQGKSKAVATVGMLSSMTVAVTSMSSTPLLALGGGVCALALWPLRNRMRLIRWATALCLVGLHLVMKAPVWALIARVDVIGGSSGDHRYQLVNQFINHFDQWWLLGTKLVAHWGFEMADLSNQYVELGVTGGLATLVCFIGILVCGFSQLGKARKASEGNDAKQRFYWVLGAALFSNTVAFFGISYFDQIIVAWYTLLAFIACSTAEVLSHSAEKVLDEPMIGAPVSAFASKAL